MQLEPDTRTPLWTIPDADTPEEARVLLQELPDRKDISIISHTATGTGRTNLIELDTVPLKYHELVDHEIKQLEEVGIISRSMCDWAQPYTGGS